MNPTPHLALPADTASTDWLGLAVRTAHVAVGISRLSDGLFVEVNDAFCRLFGYARGEIVGHTSLELGLWPEAAQRERMIEQLRRHGQVTSYPSNYRHRSGEVGDLSVSARIVELAGEPHLVGFLNDVTAERDLVIGLRPAQARLGVILRTSGVLVFHQDAELRYTWVTNPALGASEHELLGRTDAEVMGAEAAAPLTAIKSRVLASGRAERVEVWVEHQGRRGCFDLVVEPELDAVGRVSGIVCAATDITARLSSERDAAFERARRAVLARATQLAGLARLIGREPLSATQAARLGRSLRVLESVSRQWRAPAAAPADHLRSRHAGKRVLVADGNPVVREHVCGQLECVGLQVLAAGSGVEAFDLAARHAPSLVLIDVELPQRGGEAAARAIRASARERRPIIALMSDQPWVDPGNALDADLDDVIEKPVSGDLLLERVAAWLDLQ